MGQGGRSCHTYFGGEGWGCLSRTITFVSLSMKVADTSSPSLPWKATTKGRIQRLLPLQHVSFMGHNQERRAHLSAYPLKRTWANLKSSWPTSTLEDPWRSSTAWTLLRRCSAASFHFPGKDSWEWERKILWIILLGDYFIVLTTVTAAWCHHLPGHLQPCFPPPPPTAAPSALTCQKKSFKQTEKHKVSLMG